MYYECRKCNRKFDELQRLGKVRFCGDFWKCTDCNHDITKDSKSLFNEAMELADLICKSDEYASLRDAAMKERRVTDTPVSVEKVRCTSLPVDFEIDPKINQYQ